MRAAPRNLGEEILEGTIDDVSYRSPDGRFTVAQVSIHRAGGKTEPMTAVGDLGAVSPGETLRMHGRASRHAKYGDRFRVRTFTPVIPSTASGIERFLGSGMIPGIGKGLAKKLVKKFGDRTLDVIATESGRLREVDGIGKQRAAAISDAVKVRREEAERLAFLHGLGLGPAMARRIIERFGDDAARVVRDDPYLVAEEVRGIGFRTADAIGRAMGIPDDDPRRAAGVVMHVLARGADSGHTYLPRPLIVEEARQLDVPPDRVSEAVDALAGRGLTILDTIDGAEAVYAPPLHRAERRLADRLRALARPRAVPANAESAVRRAIGDTSLSEEQERAVASSVSHGLMVLTGGPGTGKTTTIRAIVQAQLALERRILLAAPTGRAAKRMTEATGMDAKTVHRLLEWNPRTGASSATGKRPSTPRWCSWTRPRCWTSSWPARSSMPSPPLPGSCWWAMWTSCHRWGPGPCFARCCGARSPRWSGSPRCSARPRRAPSSGGLTPFSAARPRPRAPRANRPATGTCSSFAPAHRKKPTSGSSRCSPAS